MTILAQLSPYDAKWDLYRNCADIVAQSYRLTEFHQYSQKILNCANRLQFYEDEQGQLKLYSTIFCKFRCCPICQSRRVHIYRMRLYKSLPVLASIIPTWRWLFLTLTVRNCQVIDLKNTIGLMREAFKRFSNYCVFPGYGWIRSLEVTKEKSTELYAHPHYHVMLLVPPGYFGKSYLTHDQWVALWRKALGCDYLPSVRVSAVRADLKIFIKFLKLINILLSNLT